MLRNIVKCCLFLFLSVSGVALAQTSDCPTLVNDALAATDASCADLGRNMACYGYISDIAQPFEGVANFTFAQQGDQVNIADIQTLKLSQLNASDDVWGIALMKIQANLPDTLPGQNVTMLMFGDVQLKNAVEPGATLTLNANQGVNVRLHPSSKGQLVGSLTSAQQVAANGRYVNSDGEEWIRIRFEEHAGRTGWVIGQALDGDGRETLPLVQPGDPVLGAMQAFYFTSTIEQAGCTEAPESGILLQTPKGVETVNIRANGVDISLASTVFLQTHDDAMYVSTLEGHVSISADGVTQFIPPGTVSRIPLDPTTGISAGPPEYPQPYNDLTIKPLPVANLPEVIVAAAPLENQAITEAVAVASGSQAAGGQWKYSTTGCPNAYPISVPVDISSSDTTMTISYPANMWYPGSVAFSNTFTLVSSGVYQSTNGDGTLWIIRVVKPDLMQEDPRPPDTCFPGSGTYSR